VSFKVVLLLSASSEIAVRLLVNKARLAYCMCALKLSSVYTWSVSVSIKMPTHIPIVACLRHLSVELGP